MNNFKKVNDRYSHMVGNQILQEISQLLLDNNRESEILVRYGGDEFMLVMPEMNGQSTVVVERIASKHKEWNDKLELIDEPLKIAINHSHWFPGEDITLEKALKKTDENMYNDKKERITS